MKALCNCIVILMVVAVFSGCQDFCGAPQIKEPVKLAPAAAPTAPPPAKQLSASPSTGCGTVRIDKVMPKQVNVQEPFEYDIVVTNLLDGAIEDVVVTERLADNFQYAGSKPAAKQDRQVLEWKLPALAPKGSKTFTVAGKGSKAGDIVNCSNVTYYYPNCGTTKVLEPQLAISHTASNTKVICDMIDLSITVKNQGTGAANNITVSAKLPEGLTAAGASAIDINVGTLGAGETKTYPAKLKASKTGTYTLQAAASGAGNLSAQSAPTTTQVTQPVLAIAKTGPATQFLGRAVEYTITVTNKGNSAALDTVVEDTLPANIGDIRASENGARDGSVVKWNLGALAAGASKTLTVSYMPTKDGTLSNKATATAYCANAVSASAETVIKGIPALLLEVIDTSDPVEVGKDETYRITVTNQGSAVATNITVKCTLEAEFMQYVSTTGATTGSLSNNVVVLETLKSLAPKARATWEVRVKAVKAGDVRFRVTMNSDQLGRDVEETEATNFYQ
jgi:uncharacterized repeat protein (TIGR01451 family)